MARHEFRVGGLAVWRRRKEVLDPVRTAAYEAGRNLGQGERDRGTGSQGWRQQAADPRAARPLRAHELHSLVPAIADAMGAPEARDYPLFQPSLRDQDQRLLFSDTAHQAAIKPGNGRGGQHRDAVIVVGHDLLDGPKDVAIKHVARTLAGVGKTASDPAHAAQLAGDYARGYSDEVLQRSRSREITRSRPGPEVGSR